ncbi:facilitated trehalose transporter Tret1-like isoform X2 [Lycorma delicatula]
MSFSAVLLPQLEVKNSDYNISTTESSWIASLLVLSTPVGSLLSGPIADRYGRKIGNWLTCLPAMTAWLMIAFSPRNTVMWLYIARVLGGLGGGMTTTFIVYVSEISHEKYRAMFLGLNSIAVSLGVLIITANGVFMNWKTMALCYGLFSLITLILICTVVPESPYWLLVFSKKNNCRSDAEKVLKWLNPNKEIYEKKLHQILVTRRKIEEDKINEKNEKEFCKKIRKTLSNLLKPEILLPILLLMGLIMLQQLTGGYSIMFYTIHLIKKLGGHFAGGIDEYDAFVIMGIIRFLMSILAGGLSRIVGRRPLLIISSLGMGFSCFLIVVYQYFQINQKLPQSISLVGNETLKYTDIHDKINVTMSNNEVQATGHWFPMLCLLFFVCTSAIGLLNIPWTMMGEILPLSIRGTGSGFLISFAYIVMFFTVKIYPFLLDSINIGTIFFMQGTVCLITVIFTYILLPETLGKSLNEIENYFSRNVT